MDTLFDIYEQHKGNLSDKWLSYLQVYDKLLKPYRDKPVRILEIGVQNGGSLDIWAQYFHNAECVVGCDIEPKCANIEFESPLVKLVVGDATSDDALEKVRAHSSSFDIIIDDGSHTSPDIIRSFAKVFPMIADDGLYVCEDLHCSYFKEFDGGLEDPRTSQSFFRRLSDYVNHEHWSAHHELKEPIQYFENEWGVEFSEEQLLRVHSVGFTNSICYIEKRPQQENLLQERVLRGTTAVVNATLVDKECFDANTMPASEFSDSAPLGSIEARAAGYGDLMAERDALQKAHAQTVAELAKAKKQLGVEFERCSEQNALRMERELEVDILTGRYNQVRSELADVRKRPIRSLKDKVKFKFLKAVMGSRLPISERARARFERSAFKRDPMRSMYDPATAPCHKSDYDIWRRRTEISHQLSERQVQDIEDWAEESDVTISVVMPVYNPDPNYLEECLLSVLNQSFKRWQFCIADDASTDPEVRRILTEYADKDPRIQVVFRAENGHISRASNSALELATGSFVALLDHDDMLPKHALAHVAFAIQHNPNAKLIYSDEDKLDDKGQRVDPHFKSDWNRDLFYTHNYITHLSVIDRSVVDEIGGFRVGYEGAQDYDLLLRVVAQISDENIHHIAKVLYHWRAHSGSTAQTPGAKSYTHEAGKKALEGFLHQNETADVVVDDGLSENFYRVVWPLPDNQPKVSIIIPTRDYKDILEVAVESILQKTEYSNYEIVIVDNGSEKPETLEWFDDIQAKHSNVHVLRYDAPFNYSAINNFAVEKTTSDIIALVNNDVEVIDPLWLREMVSHAVREDVGCVGAKLYYTNGQIQHGGVIMGIGGVAGHSHRFFDRKHPGYVSRLHATQNFSAVTGACLILRRSLYEAVGGLNSEHLAVAYNDVDLCLKVQAEGYRNVWTPYADLFHHESASRGYEDTPEKQARLRKEGEFMIGKWKIQDTPDPYYSPNLTLDREDFSINTN